VSRERKTGGSTGRWDAFVRSLYFDIQKVDGVKPLEIWGGLKEIADPRELTRLVQNLYKIVIPLANESLTGREFSEHSRASKEAVTALLTRLREQPNAIVFDRFPDPPTQEEGQKQLYQAVKKEAASAVKNAVARRSATETGSLFPDGLFDFGEMRVVDNELPFIIFTEKEFRVIHGLMIVYLWLIDFESILMESLEENGVEHEVMVRYWHFSRKVAKEVPLVVQGETTDPRGLVLHLSERLKQADYLDVFEAVYRWYESAQETFIPAGR